MSPRETCDAYVRLFETLSPELLDRLPELVTEDVWFLDPFNDLRGPAALRRVLDDAIARLGRPLFFVTRRAWDGDICFLRWRMVADSAGPLGRPWIVEGVSELHFAPDGRIALHFDHWDAGRQLYERLPLLGRLLRLIRRRLAASAS